MTPKNQNNVPPTGDPALASASGSDLRTHSKKLAEQLAECAGYLATVRTDRKIRDQHGDIYVGQTLEWADGAKGIVERSHALLDEHDNMDFSAFLEKQVETHTLRSAIEEALMHLDTNYCIDGHPMKDSDAANALRRAIGQNR